MSGQDQWWLATLGRTIVWARLRVREAGTAEVFDSDGNTLAYDSEDTARAALMDAEWLYGSEPQNIYTTIIEGRPKGMPAFGGKVPDQQIWQLVAYVQSMSGNAPLDVVPLVRHRDLPGERDDPFDDFGVDAVEDRELRVSKHLLRHVLEDLEIPGSRRPGWRS